MSSSNPKEASSFGFETLDKRLAKLDNSGVQVTHSPNVAQIASREADVPHGRYVAEVEMRCAHLVHRTWGQHVITRDEDARADVVWVHFVKRSGSLQLRARYNFANGLPSDAHYFIHLLHVHCIGADFFPHFRCGSGCEIRYSCQICWASFWTGAGIGFRRICHSRRSINREIVRVHLINFQY